MIPSYCSSLQTLREKKNPLPFYIIPSYLSLLWSFMPDRQLSLFSLDCCTYNNHYPHCNPQCMDTSILELSLHLNTLQKLTHTYSHMHYRTLTIGIQPPIQQGYSHNKKGRKIEYLMKGQGLVRICNSFIFRNNLPTTSH